MSSCIFGSKSGWRTIGILLVMAGMLLAVFPAAQAGILPYQTLDKGYQTQWILENDVIMLINTSEELEAFYAMLGTGNTAPDIDMTQATVLAVVAAPRPSSGYELEITALFESDDMSVDATVVDSAPGDSCITLLMETTPYHLVVTPRKIQSDMNQVEWKLAVNECK